MLTLLCHDTHTFNFFFSVASWMSPKLRNQAEKIEQLMNSYWGYVMDISCIMYSISGVINANWWFDMIPCYSISKYKDK